jgi:hypothetical protein
MSQLLVNAIYPIDYFTLPGVEEVQYPDRFWWSSKQRFATTFPGSDVYAAPEEGGIPTSEILEIDLGRIREINYINFDVLRVPIDIKIEYDMISAPDREAKWVEVKRKSDDDLPFDNIVFFDPRNRSGWFNAEFHFTTPRGNIVHTRYLRITFTRRNDKWPTSTSKPFKWPVFVKHLRIGRYISQYLDTVGPLLAQDTPPDLADYNLPTESFEAHTTKEVRQQFRVPANAARGEVWPSILGFGILAEVTALETEGPEAPQEADIELEWSIWDVTNSASPTRIYGGIYTGTYDVGINWINWYLEDQLAILTNPYTKYEFRIRSLNDATISKLFLTQQRLSTTELPGTFNFTLNSTTVVTTEDMEIFLEPGEWISTPATSSILKVASFTSPTQFELTNPYPSPNASGQTAKQIYPIVKWDGTAYSEDAAFNLVMRIWADVADEGKDVLGNSYRYGVKREKAQYVVDGTRAGWMSDPKPSKDAVEALYFDVRQRDEDTGEMKLCLIDAIRIAPRTPGVKMNIYYSKENLDGEKPKTTAEWDYLLWHPVSQFSFQLRRNQIIDLPSPIRAAYVKLEFTDLNPLPWRVPNYPPLPPKLFRRFPTWVEEQFTNSQLRNVIEDWWIRKATPVQIQILNDIRDPVLEFEYKEREFFSALALGEIEQAQIINQNLVSAEERAVIDPVTGSKIYLQFADKFKKSLLVSVDQNSVLGKAVINRYDPHLYREQVETKASKIITDSIPTVSSINDRISEAYSHLATIPMRFNRTARHVYREDLGEFNKKAYFVGIDEVEFLRNNYAVKFNDKIIKDILYDDELLEFNSWSREQTSSIPDGATLYVSYFNDTFFEDEAVTFNGFTPVKLEGKGGPLYNVRVYSLPQKRGIQYFENDDWVVSHKRDVNGILEHYIARSPYTERLAAPTQPLIFVDSYTVIGKAFIPAEPKYDEGTIVGVAVISGEEGPFVPNFGTGVYGGGIYEDLRSTYADTNTSTGVGVVSGIENIRSDDAATVIGIAVVSGEDLYN